MEFTMQVDANSMVSASEFDKACEVCRKANKKTVFVNGKKVRCATRRGDKYALDFVEPGDNYINLFER